jgi:dTDP-4-amino-4,6-dideoxygalactose transaminase
MRIPLLDLKRQHAGIGAEVESALLAVVRSQHFILGPAVEQFETALAAHLGIEHVVGVASGTDALHLSLRALDVGPGDEVVTTAFSFFATAGTIALTGARPVFADIDPRTFNLAPASVEERITPRTKAIVVVHLFGQCAAMGEIGDIGRRHGLPVIEDAAQAIGATCEGRPAGGMGVAGCLSFFPSKNLGAFGDGGAVVTRDAEVARKVRRLRAHGSEPKYVHHLVGTNSRLDAIQAAVLRAKLGHLARWTEARREHAAHYSARLSGCAGVRVPHVEPGCHHVFNQYTLRVPDRDGLRAHLATAGVGTEIYYPLPLHLQPCFADLGYRSGDLPESERAATGVISLPVFPELREVELDYVMDSIERYYAMETVEASR